MQITKTLAEALTNAGHLFSLSFTYHASNPFCPDINLFAQGGQNRTTVGVLGWVRKMEDGWKVVIRTNLQNPSMEPDGGIGSARYKTPAQALNVLTSYLEANFERVYGQLPTDPAPIQGKSRNTSEGV